MSGSPLLRVENLTTRLRTGKQQITAVDDISFDISRGQTFCLVGESGSGKSITALSIIRLLPADISSHPQGKIQFDYRGDDGSSTRVDMLRNSEDLNRKIRGARIAMIFQEPMNSLNPVFTIGEQIMEALQLHRPGLSDDEARSLAIAALEQVQIPDAGQRVDDYPHRLSGGQRQRVMIAMAMACEPDLLIADEPTTALDVTVQAEILRLMRDLQQRRGTSILFITHDFGVVSAMADQVGVMKDGKIVESGPIDAVLHRPQHAYTRQLLAALPENLARPAARQPVPANSAQEKPTTADPLLQLDNLQVHFPVKKGVWRHTVDYIRAVDGINLEIPRGDIVALVGESGCGKTTLGRAVLRLEQATGGDIRFDRQSITGLSRQQLLPLRRKMQFIFQDPMSSLNPRLSIAAALTEPMAVHGIGRSPADRLERAARTLEKVQLRADHLWRYPHEFSGGQRQRIGIARALVLGPEFIVCDEITSALDVSVQAEILQLLLQLQQEHRLTLLFITHNIGVVEYLSNTMAVMYRGRIVEYGATATICKQPRHDYTEKLLNAVPRMK